MSKGYLYYVYEYTILYIRIGGYYHENEERLESLNKFKQGEGRRE